MRFVKKEQTEERCFVPEIAQAIGLSEGTIHGFFRNRKDGEEPLKKSLKDGLTLDEIEMVIERKRTRGDGIDFDAVNRIRNRLISEKGYEWEDDEDNQISFNME